MAVGPIRRDISFDDGQAHCLHDLLDDRLPLQNAAIGIEREPLGLSVEDNSATRRLLVVDVTWYCSETLVLCPVVDVALAVVQAIPIRLSLGE
jgi:hypothetical protein